MSGDAAEEPVVPIRFRLTKHSLTAYLASWSVIVVVVSAVFLFRRRFFADGPLAPTSLVAAVFILTLFPDPTPLANTFLDDALDGARDSASAKDCVLTMSFSLRLEP